MKKISQEELSKMKAKGATVKRKMGGQPAKENVVSLPGTPVAQPEKPKEKAPDGLTQALNALVDQHAATSAIVAQNSEVIKSLFVELAQLTDKVDRKPISFDFKISRNRLGFMENITATPVMDDRETH